MAGSIEDRWLNKKIDPETGKRKRTNRYGKGKRYRVTGVPGVSDCSFNRLQDAKTWLAKAQAGSWERDFLDPRDGNITLREYIETVWLPVRTDAISTRDSMNNRIRNHILPLLGDKTLNEIRKADVLRQFKADLKPRVADSTANTIWRNLSSILTSAVESRLLPSNPCREHRSIRAPKMNRSPVQAWNRETIDKVRAGLPARYQIAVDLGVGLGLRQGEAFGLALEDFDRDAGIVRLRRQLRWSMSRAYFALPKGGKERTIPIPDHLMQRVDRAAELFPPVPCTLPWENPEPPKSDAERRQRHPVTANLLLTTIFGNRIRYHIWNDQSWKPALEKAGIVERVGEKAIRSGNRVIMRPVYSAPRKDMFHVLRHTYASVQLQAGESVMSVSQWLGHSSPVITLSHYAHFMPESESRGQAALGELFK